MLKLLLYKFGEERGEIGLPRVMERKGGKEKGSLPFLQGLIMLLYIIAT